MATGESAANPYSTPIAHTGLSAAILTLENYFRFTSNRKYCYRTSYYLPDHCDHCTFNVHIYDEKRLLKAISGQTASRNMAETAKMNSQLWTSYSTPYTLWGLSRRYLPLY